MKSFQQHLRTAGAEILERFPAELKPEIYAVSFNIWRIDYDPRRPYVAIGYNTESQYRRESRPEDPGEARWNYACWLLDGFEMLGNVPEDPVGSPLYVDEVKRLGLWFDGEGDDASDDQYEALGEHFADACTGLARHFHSSGLLKEVLGRPVPVQVFDMDRPGWEVEATEAANPPGLVADFLAWQRAAAGEA
ncbi:hypothetical protein G5C60_23835 [Streptomyces sp. HC44]|uniref:Uncharacterized protein n=1 Tax=Streptomyces scabichelini TaxID=2711217 RepID=A0A6G4V9M6_9ACTN|nr:hypothetical protein [Streptomyces scabichelini]NGO10540.1 hypothetical protein [Streptomyces scabichelini]